MSGTADTAPRLSEGLVVALKAVRKTPCPDWCSDTNPGVHTHCVLDAMRSLPVAERMEAMGMAEAVSWGKPVVITHYHDKDDLERSIFPHHRPAYVEACDQRVGADHTEHQPRRGQ